MNQDQKQIKIAEACGHNLPLDYFRDLNAANKMEEALFDGRTASHPNISEGLEIPAEHIYWHWLWVTSHRDYPSLKFLAGNQHDYIPGEPVGRSHGVLARSTAEQRAEAFGLTFKLWT